jgi:hypothetical protein
MLSEAHYDAAIILQAIFNVQKRWDISKERLASVQEMREETGGAHLRHKRGIYSIPSRHCQHFTDAVLNEAILIAISSNKELACNDAARKELKKIMHSRDWNYFSRPTERMLQE